MNTLSLNELVKGLMIVIAIAISMGKLPELKRWAALEAFGMHPTTSENIRKTHGKLSENHRKHELNEDSKVLF